MHRSPDDRPPRTAPAAAVLSPEIRDLLERAVALPRGLAFLHRAPLESVAVTLSVHPLLVEEVRRHLDDPAVHSFVIEAFKDAVDRRLRDPRPEPFPAPPVPAPAAPGMDPEGLIRTAEAHVLGIPFLMDAPAETVAVTFGVHPFVVLEARALLERRGVPHETE